MNSPNPALVTQRAAQRLPRVALLLFCAAYVLPGVFGRDPWKNADATAFGFMLSIARGDSPWLAPALGGVPADAVLLPYWIGAGAIHLLGPWLGPELAARVPFAILLALTLVLTWYTSYHLARTEAAQPLPLAFGGEATPTDYARAIADGALLALIACLGLLQLGHETTPELAQLTAVTLYLYSLAASPSRPRRAAAAALVALPAMAVSGAPAVAIALGMTGVALCLRSSYAAARVHAPWVGAATVIAAIVATVVGAWGWRLVPWVDAAELIGMARQFAWFTWPAWPLVLWALWRWRRHLLHRHISVPAATAAVVLATWLAMAGSDRALMLLLPAFAVLAAFTLPTLHRSTAAAVDWFSVFFFSVCALAIWVVYVAMQTGFPVKPAANVARLAPGFVPSFAVLPLVAAVAASLAWIWLVRWRTGRQRHPLWKSMVLPASGVALCWLLLMTLWLPLLDYARSYRPLIDRLALVVPAGACVAAAGLPLSQVAALEHLGGYRVDAATTPASTRCETLLMPETRSRRSTPGAGWDRVGQESRPTERDDITAVYRRAAPSR